mmetsp:Transcript_11337/g.43788  ORF Transcript_11337/g.43788 Transcript_11337/m.43788 type:complete len:252 (+) Transcript_11337:697-1452(+)
MSWPSDPASSLTEMALTGSSSVRLAEVNTWSNSSSDHDGCPTTSSGSQISTTAMEAAGKAAMRAGRSFTKPEARGMLIGRSVLTARPSGEAAAPSPSSGTPDTEPTCRSDRSRLLSRLSLPASFRPGRGDRAAAGGSGSSMPSSTVMQLHLDAKEAAPSGGSCRSTILPPISCTSSLASVWPRPVVRCCAVAVSKSSSNPPSPSPWPAPSPSPPECPPTVEVSGDPVSITLITRNFRFGRSAGGLPLSSRE